MRDYQSKKNNPYELPDTLYKRVLALVRDYERLKEEYHHVLESGPTPSTVKNHPKGTYIANPTERKALRLSLISGELKAIEQALVIVPHEYRDGILNNINYFIRYPDDADRSTYSRWKQRFLYHVAENAGYV